MLQIRVSIPEFSDGVAFSDPIILENAGDISLSKSVSSSDEAISFTLPLTDPKLSYVTYLRWWECWDTVTNERINYGPIHDFGRTGGEAKKFGGPGRSALFEDVYKTIQTFYYPLDVFLDDLRYENLSSEPRTTALVDKSNTSPYYGLSKRTKDYAIDEQTGYITIGRDSPVRGTIKSDTYWSGTSQSDHLTIDFGENYKVAKVRVLLPWWGGVTVNNNRAYDWFIGHSNDNSNYTSVYETPVPNYHIMNPAGQGTTVYVGDETGYEFDQVSVSGTSSIDARYWRLNIHDVHAWYGNAYNTPSLSDEYGWECGQSNIFKGETLESPTVSGGVMIPTDKLLPSSDCHASAIELAFLKRIITRDKISNLSYKQIENDNRQITYFHQPEASELIGGHKFEPGTFFRKMLVNSPGEVKDEWNAVLYSGGGLVNLDLPSYTRLLTFSGSPTIDHVDTWIGVTDAFSYGGSYQYTTIPGDWLVLHFRGESIKWIATVPDGSTAGHASIELRAKGTDGAWGAWSTLEADFTLPTNIAGQKVWEIEYKSDGTGLLQPDTVYELRITCLSGYVSIDAFAGYWSASYKEMNEDDSRWGFRNPQEPLQYYDGRYSLGSAYQYKPTAVAGTKQGISFTGDRVIVTSRKFKPLYGKMLIGIVTNPPDGPIEKVMIPGGESDGRLLVDLTSDYNVTQAVVFDSNDYFTDENGLPWGTYRLIIYKTDDEGKIWVDGIGIHETEGLSVKFVNSTYLDVLKSTAEALQLEWDITEDGLRILPRIGIDTDIIFAEGHGTTIKIDDNEDAKEVATQLISNGADIDGIPMSTIVEDKATRKVMGRTIQRMYDLRNVGDYFTLIGASRAELIRRRTPKKSVTITRVGTLGVNLGDSFMVVTPEINCRMRATKVTRNQSSSGGSEYVMECVEWPPVI